jgi:hypothetical protein
MKKVKFYALVCRNMHAVKRHQRTIPKEDLVIVINTLDEAFEELAVLYCLEEGIEYYVTESNGTPSQGKNSVLDLFEKSDNDYMVLVDGDDFLTPHGVWTYKEIANSYKPIDVLALKYQYGIQRENGYNYAIAYLGDPAERSALLGNKDPQNPDTIHGAGTRCFLNDHEWWYLALSGKLVEVNEADEHSVKFNDVHTRWATLCYHYIDNWETHLRLVMFSKKAVKGNRFDTNFHIGEDTLFYLMLKDLALKTDLVMKHHFDILPTYVYDTRVAGVVEEERNKYGEPGTVDFGWYLWLKKLVDEYERYNMMGMLSTEKLPDIKVKTPYSEKENKHFVIDDESYYDVIWPEGYRPDTLGLVNYPNYRPVYS